MKRRKSLITFLTFVLIILTTFAYSALSTRFQVIIDVQFRADANIRITDILLDSTSNGGLISFDSNYTKNTITSGFKLPNLNSTVSYNVTITNKGNIDQAIYNITTISSSNNNIYYLIDDKPINEVLPMIVPLGTSKTIKITYKTTSPFSNTETIVNNFEFKKVYYVDYNLKGGSYTNDQNDLKNGQIKYEDVPLTLTNEKPTKSKYVFIGWTDEQNGTTVKYQSGSTYTLNENKIMYAVWRTGEATFISGSQFNSKIKILAGNANATYSTQDTNITSIVRANSLPNGFTPTEANIVSTSDSDFPIYAWYSNGAIYYYSETMNLYLNSNSNDIFRNLDNVSNIDITSVNTSRMTSAAYMILGTSSLSTIDLSNFDTSGITSFGGMFEGSSLTSVDLSSFTISSDVASLNHMFARSYNLQSITFGNNFDTSNITNMRYMFSSCTSLEILDLSKFDLSSLEDAYSMLSVMTSLKQLKTPITMPDDTTVTIDLPTTLYDISGNVYTSINSSSSTETWLKLAYTVSFNANGGTGTMNDQKIQYNTATNLTSNTFTRTNYTFVGWNTKADGTGTAYLDGASVNALASANETITLYAQWVGFTYTVTADANGGSIPSTSGWTGTGNTSTKTVNFGSTYGTLPTPTRTGYTFSEWLIKILPSQYQEVEYIKKDTLYIGNNDNLGEYINTGITINSSNYKGIRFVVDEALDETDTTQGWYLNGAANNGINAVYVGIYKNKFVYGVGRDLNSNVSIVNMSDRYKHDLNIKNNSYKVYDESNNLLVDISISKYTGFTPQGLPLYLMAYSGENRGHAGRLYGAEIYIDDVLVRKFIPCYRKSDNVAGLYDIVTNEFYTNAGSGTFTIGNSTFGEKVYNSTLVTKTENHTITAKWTPNTYSIVFDKNDNAATGTMNNQSMTYGTSSNLTNNSYYKRGFKFVGWNTASDGTGTAYLNGASVSKLTNVNNGTITLYAQWEKLMAEDVGHTIQDLNCEDVQCVIDELYYMLY